MTERRYITLSYTKTGCYFVVTNQQRSLVNISIGFPSQEHCMQAVRRTYAGRKDYSYTLEYQEDGKPKTELL